MTPKQRYQKVSNENSPLQDKINKIQSWTDYLELIKIYLQPSNILLTTWNKSKLLWYILREIIKAKIN